MPSSKHNFRHGTSTTLSLTIAIKALNDTFACFRGAAFVGHAAENDINFLKSIGVVLRKAYHSAISRPCFFGNAEASRLTLVHSAMSE